MFKVSKIVEEILFHFEEDLHLFIFLCGPASPSMLQLCGGRSHHLIVGDIVGLLHGSVFYMIRFHTKYSFIFVNEFFAYIPIKY